MRFSHRVAVGGLVAALAVSLTGTERATASAQAPNSAAAPSQTAGSWTYSDCMRPGTGFDIYRATFSPDRPTTEPLTITLQGMLNTPLESNALARILVIDNRVTDVVDHVSSLTSAELPMEGPATLPITVPAPQGEWPQGDVQIIVNVFNGSGRQVVCLKGRADLGDE